jgi:Sulfotransferase family
MITRIPNLFLVGAMKSGTTYLNKLLNSHPSIFMCCPEEPSYFVEPRQLEKLWPYMWDQGFWRSREHYLRLFALAGDAPFLGEASTNYTKLPLVSGVPEKIKEFSSNARFVYVMRDPTERSISHYWHMVRFNAEYRSILNAIQADAQFIDVSHYAMQLEPYFNHFGGDRVYTLTYEQMIHAPVETMRRLFSWLGLDASLAKETAVDQPENVTPEVVASARTFGLLQKLRQRRPFRALTPRVPAPVRRLAQRLTTRDMRRDRIDTSEVKRFLRPIQKTQTEQLSRLLGRNFPEWTTLYRDL